MTRSFRLRRLAPSVLAVVLLASACGSSSTNSSSSSGGAPTTARETKLAAATLNGSGSTFQQAFIEAAVADFAKRRPEVTINYGGGGSGKGQTDLQSRLVEFAGSDAIPKPETLPAFKGGALLYFPTVAAPITVTYNLPGVVKLHLSAATIAEIFQRSVKKWDDAAIKADNPGAKLPGTDIVVVHRADASGTTANFTKYLTMAAPNEWKLGTDKTVAWPSDTRAGTGNAGVASAVKSTDGAVGYVDYSDAKAAGLTFASVENAAGSYIEPSLESASAALAGTTVAADLGYNPLNAAGAKAYPITSPTWILVYKTQTDHAKGAALEAFLAFVLGAGQDLAAGVDYAKLPEAIRSQAVAQLDQIQVP
ncbi:MAG: phosphate ABC transporter substrate-binding protein PstS [Acidimicrobiia bacterium]